MNSSKLSLKEGFDFLFEEKTKKFKIAYAKEDVAPSNVEDHIAYILTTDIVTSTINGEDEPLLFRIYNTQKGDAKSDVSFVQGKTISFELLAKVVNQGIEGFKNTFNTSPENVENIAVIADIYRQYKESVNAVKDAGASRMMLEAKMNVLKISKSRYAMLFRTIKNSNTFLPKQKGQKTINFTKIFQAVSARINDGELLKTKASESGKFEINDSFKDYNDSEKLYLVVYNFFKALTRDQIAPFGGKTRINNFLQILKNNGDKSTKNPKSVEELVKSFRESWAITKSGFLRKKPVSKKLSKAFDEMVAKALKTESPEEAQSAIDNAQIIIEELPDAFFNELENTLSRDGDQEDASEESDESPQVSEGKVEEFIKRGQKHLNDISKEYSEFENRLSQSNSISFQEFEKLITELGEFGGRLNAVIIAFDIADERFAQHLASDEQKRRIGQIQRELEVMSKKISEVFEELQKLDDTNDNLESGDVNKAIEDNFTTLAFNPDTVGMIQFEEIFPDLNKNEIVAKAKSEFEDMKTRIGSPSPAADEPPAVPEDEVFVQTTLSTPAEGDFNDFVRKYAAIAAFISFMSEDAGKELISDSAQNLKASQLVNLLKKYAKEVGESNRKVLGDSISNLAKFTHKNVEGILFERAGSSKYFVKMKKESFVNASNVLKITMKNLSSEDAFSDTVIGTFFPPKFELTDSNGNNLFTNIDGARLAFKNANTSKKSIEFVKDVKDGDVDTDLGRIVFKIEGKSVMNLLPSLRLIITNPIDLKGDQSNTDIFIDFAQLGGTAKSFGTELGLSKKQMQTIISFMRSISEKDKKSIDDVLNNEKISDEAKQQIGDIAKSAFLPQEPATQQLVSKKSDVEVKANVNTVKDLLNHEDIRTMMDRLYLDNSLTYAISQMNDTQILAIKNGGTDEKNKVQAMLITSLKPDMTAIKKEVRNLCSEGSENRAIWDGIFNNKFNEEAFKGAYGALIISAVDKIVRSKNARIAEGFFSKALSLVKATIGNIATPLLLMKGIGWLVGAAAMASAAPYLTALATGLVAKGLYDARKWAKEADQYRDNPIKYIEGLLDDDKIKKSAQGMVNIAVSDIVIKAIDPTHKVAVQGSAARKLRGGQSEFAAEMKILTSRYNQLSDEQKSQAKELNDFILGQMGQTRYYSRGIVSDSIINMIFNKMLFGKDRISDACRNELLSGTIDIERSEYRQELIQALNAAIKSSPVKNNFIDYIESHVRSNNRKGALTMGTEEEIKERGNTTWYGMRKSAYLSTEQININYLEELITDITGMSYEEYSFNEIETFGTDREFRESIQNRSLSSLLFEEDESRGSSELEDNITDMQAKGKKKQKSHDREVNVAVATSMLTPWYLSAYNMIKMKEVSIGGAKIFKDIHTWKTTPGTSGGTPGLFGYKISASLPKLINTVYRSPQEAAALGKAGGDGFGPQFQLNNGKFLQSYYWNGKAAIGTKKALSMIIGKTGVNAKTLGHYSEVAKNAKYLKTLGLDVDLEKGTVKAIPGSGCTEIDPSNPLFDANVKTMSTSLGGAVKAQMSNPYSFNAYNDAAHTFSDGTFSEKAVAKMSSHMLKNIMGKGLEGDLGDVTDLDPAFKNYIMKHVFSSIMSGTKMKIKMTSGSLSDVTPSDLQMTAKMLQNGMQQVINDYKAAAVKLKVAAAKKGTVQAAIDYFKDASPEGEAFNKTMIKSMNDNIFNKTVHGSGSKIVDVIQNLNNDEAHAGLNLAMKKAIVGGGLSMSKAPSTAAVKALLSKTRVEQALTGDGSTLGGDSLKVEIPDGLDWKALGIKGALLSLIPIKIMTAFAQRGVQGGKFAEFFYKMFNPQQIFYTDMLHALTGSQINIPKAQAQIVDKDGGFAGPSVNIDEDITAPNEGTSPMALGLDEIASLTEQEKASSKTESFVYENNISNFLFENKIVKKSIKKSSLQKELNDHKKLQKMFKNLI